MQYVCHLNHLFIWFICLLLILAIFAVPKIYHNYYSAPYYTFSNQQITLENSDTHKLNKYQKQQFIKIAKNVIDKEDGPFDWDNYQFVSIDVYKMKKPFEYGLIYKIKPIIRTKKSTVTNSIIIKMAHRDFKHHNNITIKGYSSDFSNFLTSNG